METDILWKMQETTIENTYIITLFTIFKPVWSTAVEKLKVFYRNVLGVHFKLIK
jgi:hypothetical protein